MKNRMLMSILALVGASLLLVGATLAWFAVSTTVNNSDIDLALVNVHAEVTLESYVNGTWEQTDSIIITASEPGDSYVYRLKIENKGNIGLNTDIFMKGFNPLVTNGLSLLNVITISSYNNVNTTYEISTMTLSSAIAHENNTYSPNLLLASDVSLAIAGIGYIYFTLSLPGSVSNEYQNLSFEIQQIVITLASE